MIFQYTIFKNFIFLYAYQFEANTHHIDLLTLCLANIDNSLRTFNIDYKNLLLLQHLEIITQSWRRSNGFDQLLKSS